MIPCNDCVCSPGDICARETPPLVPAGGKTGLNALARMIHAANAHWWHHLATGERLQLDHGERFMLMVSEVAEAMEGERKSLMDDHLPHRRMPEVELADVMIRILDYAGAYNLDLDRGVVGLPLPAMPANKADALRQIAHEFTAIEPAAGFHWTTWRLCRAISLTQRYAFAHGYDLDGAIAEKRAYNAQRADHKAEARLAAGGKKF